MYNSCICVDDGDGGYAVETYPKARKQHICTECRDTISPGETYERAAVFSDGHVSTFKTCRLCLRIRRSLFRCGWYYGHIWHDIMDLYGVGPNGEIARSWKEKV
jgi:hypothetical protein